MPTFHSSRYNSPSPAAQKYRALVQKRPFLMFGLPFITLMVAGSFFLTPATAVRFERHDRKIQTTTTEQALSVGKHKRRVDPKEEYYVSSTTDARNLGVPS